MAELAEESAVTVGGPLGLMAFKVIDAFKFGRLLREEAEKAQERENLEFARSKVP